MSSNRLLSNLSRQDFALLEPHLEAIDLPLRKRLEKPNRRIDHVYFINAGFASVVANGSNKPIEVGLIGREGMTGLSIVLGDVERTANETYMQAAGAGQRMSAGKLRDAIANSRSLHRNLLRYAHAFLIQTTSTALANGRSKSEERLARWLLMADDRLDGDELPLTHDFLAVMLGTHRPGVTLAVQALEKKRLITARRGSITILNRKGLEKRANGTYVPVEA